MALFRLHKKQWETGFRPSYTLTKSKSKTDFTPTSLDTESDSRDASCADSAKPHKRTCSISLSGRSPPPSPSWDSDRPCQASNLSLTARRSKPPKRTDDTKNRARKGVSSGLSTVVKRSRGTKEVTGRGMKERTKPVNTIKPKEEWWKTLGRSAGSKGTVRV